MTHASAERWDAKVCTVSCEELKTSSEDDDMMSNEGEAVCSAGTRAMLHASAEQKDAELLWASNSMSTGTLACAEYGQALEAWRFLLCAEETLCSASLRRSSSRVSAGILSAVAS
jgi:hypothetical protein